MGFWEIVWEIVWSGVLLAGAALSWLLIFSTIAVIIVKIGYVLDDIRSRKVAAPDVVGRSHDTGKGKI